MHEETFEKDIDDCFLLGLLEKSNASEWVVPYFPHTKTKKNQVRLLSVFRYLNNQLECKLYPMPKTNVILFKVEGIKYSTSHGLSMVYYHIQINSKESN